MESVTASAPGKLLLYGDHAVVHGFPCIVTAVDQRMHVSVQKIKETNLVVNAPDLQITAYSKPHQELGKKNVPKSVAFIETCYKHFLKKYPQTHGILVSTKSDFSSQFGFGSSSAVTVAFAKALTVLHQVKLSNKNLFDLCYQAVIEVQGVGSGFDIACAIWGGTIYYVSPAKIVKSLQCDDIPLIVGYTGIKADTPTLVNMVGRQKQQSPKKIDALFKKSERVVDAATQTMNAHDWQNAGALMNQNQEILRALQVSTPILETLISAAIDAGAHGAKLSGAGGGDCMIAVGDSTKKSRIEMAIKKAGGTVLSIHTNQKGVQLET